MRRIVVLLTVSLFFFSSQALPASEVAYVHKLDGKVEFKSKKDELHWANAHKLMPLYVNNLLKTSDKSQIQIRYMDAKSLFTMLPNSEIVLKEGKGGLRAIYHRIGKVCFESTDVRMLIETPTTIQVSKGTRWQSMVNEDGETTVIVNRGSIVLKNDVSEKTLTPGSKAVVKSKEETITVAKMEEKELLIEFKNNSGQIRTLVIKYTTGGSSAGF